MAAVPQFAWAPCSSRGAQLGRRISSVPNVHVKALPVCCYISLQEWCEDRRWCPHPLSPSFMCLNIEAQLYTISDWSCPPPCWSQPTHRPLSIRRMADGTIMFRPKTVTFYWLTVTSELDFYLPAVHADSCSSITRKLIPDCNREIERIPQTILV